MLGFRETHSGAGAGSRTAGRERPQRFRLYGLPVLSDLPLPVAPLPATEDRDTQPAWTFRDAGEGQAAPEPDGPPIAQMVCRHGNPFGELYRGPGGAWFRTNALGTCHVPAGGQPVEVYLKAGADRRAMGILLAGQVSIFLLQQRGQPCLHASAVVTDHGTIAFLGRQGQGKTTLAAAYLRRGAALLTDDALPLQAHPDGVYGTPGLSFMKLWSETAEHVLHVREPLPSLARGHDKKIFALEGARAFATAAAPLRAIYLLARYDPAIDGTTAVSIQPLTGQKALAALLAYSLSEAFLRPDEASRFLPLYLRLLTQAPLRLLRYPTGFAYQGCVQEHILMDMERR